MAQRTLIVRIKNTGTIRYTFWVGATISNKVSGTGCGIYIPSGGYYKDLPPASITLDPGKEGEVRFTFDDAYLDKPSRISVNPGQTLYAIVKVWKEYDRTRNVLKGCLAGTYKTFTAKGAPVVKAQIVSVTIY